MTPEEMKSYLESIEEFIHDEKKVVSKFGKIIRLAYTYCF